MYTDVCVYVCMYGCVDLRNSGEYNNPKWIFKLPLMCLTYLSTRKLRHHSTGVDTYYMNPIGLQTIAEVKARCGSSPMPKSLNWFDWDWISQIAEVSNGTVCNKNGLKGTITHGSFYAMVVRIPATVSIARAKASSDINIFRRLSMIYFEPNIQLGRNRNAFGASSNKSCHQNGMKHPCCVTSGKKTNITVVGCVNASDHYIPPEVI